MYDLPSYVWTPVLAGVIGIPVATRAVLRRGATGIRRHGGPVGTVSILSSERVADTKIVRYATEAFIGSD